MLSKTILFFTLSALSTLSLAQVSAPIESASVIASADGPISTPTIDTDGDSRPEAEVESSGGGLQISSDENGGTLKSTMPLGCVVGCQQILLTVGECQAIPDSESCAESCTQTAYDNFIACLDCLAYNGYPIDDPEDDATASLVQYNEFCASQNATVSSITTITATSTTSGPFETSWKGPNVTLETWTGLTRFITDDESTTSPTGFATSRPSGSASGSSLNAASRFSASAASAATSAASAAASSGAAMKGVSMDGKVGLTGLAALAGWFLA